MATANWGDIATWGVQQTWGADSFPGKAGSGTVSAPTITSGIPSAPTITGG